MKSWNVVIRATVTKTIQVEAESLEKAEEMAHEEFSVLNDQTDENYEQNAVSSEEVKDG